MADGFWGVDDSGRSDSGTGIRHGRFGIAGAPSEAKTAGGRVFLSGDRVGLLVDMGARTLAIYRDGAPIPGLTFTGLPAEVYVGATPDDRGARVRIEQKALPAQAAAAPRACLLYTSPSPRDATLSRMPSSA